jgi:hypothetical protein
MVAKPTHATPDAWEAMPDVEKVWLEEARRRLANADRGVASTLSLAEVRSRLARRRG